MTLSNAAAVLVLVTLICVTSGLVPTYLLDRDWHQYKRQFQKQYLSSDENFRYNVWTKNSILIFEHNKEALKGLHSYTMAVNQFADMTSEEFVSTMMGFKQPEKGGVNSVKHHERSEVRDLPDSVDWRAAGYVTGVGNEGQCGSCWAFTAIGALEGQHKKKTGKLVALSAQNLMDCSRKQGNQGCEGGLMDSSFTYVKDNGGIDTNASYPYTSGNGQVGKCKYNKTNVAATCTGFVDLPNGDEHALQVAVAHVGPISIAVDASRSGFQLYKKGVYDDPGCSKTVDHSLVVTGYGVEDGKLYWECKNSWGEQWGADGYIRMVRNKDNQCGIANTASYPTV